MVKKTDHSRHTTAREAALAYENTKKLAQPQPDDLVYDPRHGMKVSRFGTDKGAIARDSEVVEIFDPITGQEIKAQRVCSVLARLLKQGAITTEMARVGEYFQNNFIKLGYEHHTSVKLDGGGAGGGDGIEGHLTRTLDNKKSVDNLLRAVGYPKSQMGKAAYWILGMGLGLEDMVERVDLHGLEGCGDRRYWKAMLISALQVMEQSARSSKGGTSRRRLRVQSSVSAGEYVVRSGHVNQCKQRS